MSKVISIMGTSKGCSDHYKTGPSKGKPCRLQGTIRLDGTPFCGAHAKGQLKGRESFQDLSIDEIKELAVDKDRACANCNLKYHTKEVIVSRYKDGYYYTDQEDDEDPTEGDIPIKVCASCYKDIVSCLECSKEATSPDPHEEVENPQAQHKLAYCDRHYKENRKDAFGCCYEGCTDEVTKPSPWDEDGGLRYCNSHYEKVKEAPESELPFDMFPDFEDRLVAALSGKAGDVLAEKIVALWQGQQPR